MHGEVLASFVWSSTKNHWIERTELNLIMRIWTFYFSSSNHACFDHLFRETTQSTALEQERFDIRSLSRALRNLWLIGTLRSNDADGNENVKKTIGLISKTTTLHVHYTFCTFLSRFCTTTTWKCLISRFMENLNKQPRNFISVCELKYGPLKFSFRRIRLQLKKEMGRNNRYKDWKNANSLFKWRYCCRRVFGP